LNHNLELDNQNEIISNPEFMAEGTAVSDLINPDKILIGGENPKTLKIVSSIYEKWVDKDKIITTSLFSSELSKIVNNTFLAQRISSINAISELCEKIGDCDVLEISKIVGSDNRIGSKYLNVSIGKMII
jgi:UDPglucose 6-dehydrogenase